MSRRRAWRLGSIPEPAQEAESTLTVGGASEQGRADDREHRRHLDAGDDFTEHGVQYPDPDWGPSEAAPTPIGHQDPRPRFAGMALSTGDPLR